MPRAVAGATRRSHAARPGARRPAGSRTSISRLLSPSIAAGTAERIVGLDDLLHQLVADDVAVVEVDEADAVDVLHDPQRLDQAGGLRIRQIDLRDVAGHHRL